MRQEWGRDACTLDSFDSAGRDLPGNKTSSPILLDGSTKDGTLCQCVSRVCVAVSGAALQWVLACFHP